MNPKLRKYLETHHGLRADASDQEAQALYDKLPQADRARADAAIATPATPPATPPAPPAGQRTEPPATGPPPASPPNPAPPAEAVRQAVDAAVQAALSAESDRIRQVNELAGNDVPEETRRKAIEERWPLDKCRGEFLTAVRAERQNPGAPQAGEPWQGGIDVRGNPTALALGMGLMQGRSGLDPVKRFAALVDGTFRTLPNPEKNDQLMRAADQAWNYRDMSLVDVCREALRIEGKRIPSTRGEMIRSAVSSHTLSAIFTTNFSAALLASYTDGEDTTQGWVSESDVPNFQSNERAQMGKFGRLKKHTRGGKAEHLNTSDSKEVYSIARYTGQFVVDEMDIIDDRFGALEQHSPADMGLAAKQLRPDLVYAIILANENLSDGVALFHATHANLGSGALTSANLQALVTLLGKQRISKRTLNLRGRYLLVPKDLEWIAKELMGSALLVVAGNSDVVRGNKNALENYLEVRGDDRLGVAGVTDPRTDTARVGTATQYFVTCRPGEEGAKTIEVGYLRGTGRMPQVRSSVLQQGQWGIGWDVSHDIGGKALDFRAMTKSPGT